MWAIVIVMEGEVSNGVSTPRSLDLAIKLIGKLLDEVSILYQSL